MNTIISSLKTLLTRELDRLKQKQFTGKFKIISETNIQWKIYFCLGRIVWAEGGKHPHRAWLRSLAKGCPEVKLNKTIINLAKRYKCWNYRILTALWDSKKINQKQLHTIIESKVKEVIFDITLQESKESLKYLSKSTSADYLLDCGLKMSLILLDVDIILKKVEEERKNWLKCCQNKQNVWSPNLAPNIKYLERLEREVNKDIYKNFVKLIDGKHTIGDLAIRLDRDITSVISSLIPYINKGLLELKETGDLPQNIIIFGYSKTAQKKIKNPAKPLIACIDDSPQILKIMEQIINKKGYRFIGIQQSLRAIPTLVASNPDLIFLDIGMPVINGYEVCSQIRRITKLKDKPVIMLTGQDGIVDRVKAKVVGTSEFMNKPIEIEKINEIMEKFLAVSEAKQAS